MMMMHELFILATRRGNEIRCRYGSCDTCAEERHRGGGSHDMAAQSGSNICMALGWILGMLFYAFRVRVY